MIRTSTSSRRRRLAAAGALLCALAAAAHAQSVAFSGMLGEKALLIINGQARGVALGATVEGVKLVRLDGTQAQIEAGGKTQTLRLGGTAVLAGDTGGRGKGTRIVLPVGSGGHYTAMGADVANRIGLDPADSTQSAAMTANGAVATRTITLRQVTIGDVTVYNVEAMVMPQAMPVVLLGNSFLSHFQMHSDNDTLVLDKKN